MTSPESLLEHASWLRRLAASLVGDRSVADDLVQDTWAAALRSPPPADRPLRPWLARVVRNAARFRWRSEANRAAREAATATADAAAPSSDELLARLELQQLVARLVGELDEPFRTTILLRYAEGLEPTQIARKLGVPPGTVRWRVKEALERLRRGLDDEHGGDRKRWLLALAPIALWPKPARAAPRVVPAVGIAVAGAVAIGVATWSPAHSTSASKATVAPRAAAPVVAAAADAASASWFVQPGAPNRHVAGRVVRDGVPIAGATVRMIADDSDPIEVRSDAGGRFDLGEQAARPVALGAASGDALAAIVHVDLRDPSAASDVELELTGCSAWIAGRVTDAAGNPLRARVLREDVIGSETDASGAYELCARPTAALASQLDLVVRADGYGAVAAGVAPAGRIRRDFVLAPEATITGTAAPDAAVWLEPDRDEAARSGDRSARLVTRADADGRFRIAGAGGRYRVGAAARGAIANTQLVAVAPARSADVRLEMRPAASVHGRVVMHGQPVAGARVAHLDASAVTQADGTFVLDGLPPGRTTFTADPMKVVSAPIELVAGDNAVVLDTQPLGRIRGVVTRHGAPVAFARVDIAGGPSASGVTADRNGRYETGGLEAGSYGVYADDGRRGAYYTAGDLVTVADGETRELDIELRWGARVSGVVVDTSGAPLPDVGVRLLASDSEEGRCTTDAHGAFSCGSLQGGKTYTPVVMPGDNATRPYPGTAPAIAVAADATVTGLVLAVDPRTLSIAGTVVDAQGSPAADVRVRASGTGIDHDPWVAVPTAITDTDGRFRFDHLPPGDYDVVAETAKAVVRAGTASAVLTIRP